MSGWNPSEGSSQDPYGRPDEGSRPADGNLTGSPYPPPTGGGYGLPAPGRSRRRRSHARLWVAASGGAVLLVVLVVIIAAVTLRPSGSGPGAPAPGAPAGTPNGVQLEQLLPTSQALPSGWYLVYKPSASAAYTRTGSVPPRPMDECEDFNLGFDLGVAGDKFLSLVSETANYGAGPGDGFLRPDIFAVAPGDAAAAIDAVKPWVARCSSYTIRGKFDGLSYDNHYTVTATTVPGLGDQNLDVRVTEQKPAGAGPLYPLTDNNTLLVRVGNDLIAIECLAPPSSLITSLAGLSAPMVRKLPTASTLPTSGPAVRPTPAASPNLSLGQLNRLLPVHSGLPAQYYQNGPTAPEDSSNSGGLPLTQPPTALTCNQMTILGDAADLPQDDVNYRDVAYLGDTDSDSDDLSVTIDEVTNEALAIADLTALKTAAAKCSQFSLTSAGETVTYRTTVTSVPGLGDESDDVYMDPISASPAIDGLPGPMGIVMVRVSAGIVLVTYAIANPPGSEPGTSIPPLASIARPIVDKL